MVLSSSTQRMALPWAVVVVLASACLSIPDSPRRLKAGGGGGIAGVAGEAGSAGAKDSGGCASGDKLCAQACVSVDDPMYGCGTKNCVACSTPGPRGLTLKCDQGACRIDTCAPGFGDCNGDPSDGCEQDLNSTAEHCGACAWDCKGTPCQLGLCERQQIASGILWGRSIAVDSMSLYWASNTVDGITVASKDGKPKSGPKFNNPQALAIDNTHVYFLSKVELARWPKAGGAIQQLATGSEFRDLAVGNSNLYVYSFEANLPKATLSARPKHTSGPLTPKFTQPSGIHALTADSTSVYWTSWDPIVRKMPDTGGSVVELWTGPAGGTAWGIVASGGIVFWRGGSAVHSAPAGSTQVSTLFVNQPDPKALAVADPYMFWVNKTHIVMGNRATKSERVLASLDPKTGDDIRGVAVDGEFVYYVEYTNDETGRLFRIRRPPP